MTRLISVKACYSAGSHFSDVCFGDPALDHYEGDIRVYHFHPGEIFGVIWWCCQSDDRQRRSVAILQALESTDGGFNVPNVSQPVAILALVSNPGPAGQDDPVDCMIDEIQRIKGLGQNPARHPPEYWMEFAIKVMLMPMHPATQKVEQT